MSKQAFPALISAQRLSDGGVVYLAKDSTFVTDPADALILHDQAELEAAEAIAAQAVATRIVDPYPIAVTVEGGVAVLKYREQLRTRGPSVRPDLGPQALHQPDAPSAA